MIYGTRSNGNQHGLVLTKSTVVEVMLDRVGYIASNNLKDIKVIEPSAGDGAFAVEIIDRLYQSSLNFNFSFQESITNLTFYELDLEMSKILLERINLSLAEYSEIAHENLVHQKDFLLSDPIKCDLIIGNPPYVRHENIPKSKKDLYRRKFASFRHRSDLYIAFYEKSLSLLKSNGILSFICSNRWLKNQYGKSLRDLIRLSYCLEEIIDLEETSPFEEDVIAYPAITTIHHNRLSKKGNYYLLTTIDELSELDKSIFPSRSIDTSNSLNWFSSNYEDSTIEKSLDSIENQGFKIGIGVATGSDKVFIRKDFPSFIEQELLLPILISRDTKNNILNWSGNHILNPFDKQGNIIDLTKYPKAQAYLESEKETLQSRHIAKKNPNVWYKTIDKIHSNLIYKDKIILPDISGNSHLFIDRGHFYPHHNLYYITGNSYNTLVLLAAILMSDFVKDQLLELGNKMNGGYPRWQSQNLKRLRVPILDAIPADIAKEISVAYHKQDYQTINQLITKDQISEFEITSGQMRIFESGEDYRIVRGKG